MRNPLFLTFIALCMQIVINALPSTAMNFVGSFQKKNEKINTFAVYKTYGYLAGDQLYIIDMNDPQFPQCIKTLASVGKILSISIVNEFAYMVSQNQMLFIFNIFDPPNPHLVSQTRLPRTPTVVLGDKQYLYIGDSSGGFTIVDVSNKSNPIKISSFKAWSAVKAIKITDQRAYLLCSTNGLLILDISDKANCKFLGICNSPEGYFNDFDIIDTYALVTKANFQEKNSEIGIIDIRDPQYPVCLKTYPVSSSITSIQIIDSLAYCGTQYDGFQIYSVNLPDKPKLLETFYTPGPAYLWDIQNNIAYITDVTCGLMLLNSKDASPSNKAKEYTFPLQTVKKIKREGALLYILCDTITATDDKSCIYTFDISDPFVPRWKGRYSSEDPISDFYCKDKRLYIAERNKVTLYDFENPSKPQILGVFAFSTLSWPINQIFENNYFVIVAFSNGTIRIIDFLDYFNPKVKAVIRNIPPGVISSQGSYLYHASDTALSIFNFRDSAQAQTCIGSCPLPFESTEILIVGSYAFIANNGVQVIDISSTKSPRYIASYQTEGNAYSMCQNQDLLFIANQFNAITVFDISNPLYLKKIKPVYTNHKSVSIATYKNYLYSAEGKNGFKIISLEGINSSTNTLQKLVSSHSPYALAITHSQTPGKNAQFVITIGQNTTTIHPQDVVLNIFTSKGQLIERLFQKKVASGTYQVAFNPNKTMANGMYIAQLQIERKLYETLFFTLCK